MTTTFEIVAALIFTNIFGVLYDYTYGQSPERRKPYLNSTSATIFQLLFRNIILIVQFFLLTLYRKRYRATTMTSDFGVSLVDR